MTVRPSFFLLLGRRLRGRRSFAFLSPLDGASVNRTASSSGQQASEAHCSRLGSLLYVMCRHRSHGKSVQAPIRL